MTLRTATAGLREWIHWELNPVLLKELRQAVRSWAITGTLLAFLLILFCIVLNSIINDVVRYGSDLLLGAQVFTTLFSFLTAASIGFIPIYVGLRMLLERTGPTVDLLYVSTLSPSRIIRGKFLSGAYIALLFFSVCMPFIVFTNLLRGVDLPTVFALLLLLFFFVCAAVQLLIFFACLPVTKAFRIILMIAAGFFAIPLTAFFSYMANRAVQSGFSAITGPGGFWDELGPTLVFVTAAGILLHLLSAALITPTAANRAPAVKIYLTAIWILGGAWAIYLSIRSKQAAVIVAWSIITWLVMSIALAVVVSNRDNLSPRVRKTIPAGFFKRWLAFLFYNGAAGGLVWITLIVVPTFLVTVFWLHQSPVLNPAVRTMRAEDFAEFVFITIGSLAYAYAYGLTGLFVHREFLPRRAPLLAGVFAFAIPLLLFLVPILVLFARRRLTENYLERLQLGSMSNLFMLPSARMWETAMDGSAAYDWSTLSSDFKKHLLVAGTWSVVLMVLLARWFFRQWRDFIPLPPVSGNGAASAAPPERSLANEPRPNSDPRP